jgi:hypothetical protein
VGRGRDTGSQPRDGARRKECQHTLGREADGPSGETPPRVPLSPWLHEMASSMGFHDVWVTAIYMPVLRVA